MRATLCAILLAAALCCTSAARFPSDPLSIGTQDGWLSNPVHWKKWLNFHKDRREHKEAYFAYRYYVEPEDRKDFEDAWLELEDAVDDEEGNIIYDLKKPLSNNVEYIGYGEWKSYKDVEDHYESKAVERFIDRLGELDIPYTIVPLVKPEDVTEVTPDKDQEDDDDDDEQAHVLIHYYVPPSAQDDFEDAWDKAAKDTDDEVGAHIYSLRKVFNNNYSYYAYGTWDSYKDLRDHFESDHIHELRKTLDKHGIVWRLSPLKKIGHQPE